MRSFHQTLIESTQQSNFTTRTPLRRAPAGAPDTPPPPSRYCGTYRAPMKPHNLLSDRLAGERHRLSAHRLAVFLMRFQCGPNTYGRAFPLDRIALAKIGMLGLTQWQVRCAIKML